MGRKAKPFGGRAIIINSQKSNLFASKLKTGHSGYNIAILHFFLSKVCSQEKKQKFSVNFVNFYSFWIRIHNTDICALIFVHWFVFYALYHYVPAPNPALVLLVLARHFFVIIYFRYNFIHHQMSFHSLNEVNLALSAWSPPGMRIRFWQNFGSMALNTIDWKLLIIFPYLGWFSESRASIERLTQKFKNTKIRTCKLKGNFNDILNMYRRSGPRDRILIPGLRRPFCL